MKFVLDVPSYEDAMLAKTAVVLWKNVSNGCVNNGYPFTKLWPILVHDVCNQIDLINIPHYLTLSLKQFVEYIARQLRDWIIKLIDNVFGKYFNYDLFKRVIECSRWTLNGRLDLTESAKTLCRSKHLSITQQFEIACFYCIRDEVEHLWNTQPDTLETHLSQNPSSQTTIRGRMINFWKNKFDSSKITTLEKTAMFYHCMRWKNQSGVEFFWSLMTDDERNEKCRQFAGPHNFFSSLIKRAINGFIGKSCDSELIRDPNNGFDSFVVSIVSFLLSQMHDKQVDVLLSSDFGSELSVIFLFDFLFVECFTPILEKIRYVISDKDFYFLVVLLIKVIYAPDCLRVCTVTDCLTDLLVNASSELKSRVCGRILEKSFSDLFEVSWCSHQDCLNIGLLLGDLSVENRRKVLFDCVSARYSAECQINWKFLMFVARKFITSDEEMAIFETHCSGYLVPQPPARTDSYGTCTLF